MHKAIIILEKTIKKFNNNNLEMIGVFGSSINPKKRKINDLDLITIGSKKTHDLFLKAYAENLKKDSYNPIIFESIEVQPINSSYKDIPIHDLHYTSIDSLIKKQIDWKTVLIDMKNKTKIFYGNKSILEKIPNYKITEQELLKPYKIWAKNLKKKDEELFLYKIKSAIKQKLIQYYNVPQPISKDIVSILNRGKNNKFKDIKTKLNKIKG